MNGRLRRMMATVLSAGGGAAFIPSDISGLLGLYQTDLGAYQDSGATTPATATSNPVKLWQDQSGQANHVSAATDGKRPLVTTGKIGGKPLFAFTVAGQSALTKAFTLAQPFTLVALANAKTNYGEVHGSAAGNLLRYNGTWAMYAGTYRAGVTKCEGTQIAIAVFNGASSLLRVNGVNDPLAGTPGAGGLNALTIGSSGNHETMDAYEFILYNSALSVADCERLETYLRDKYTTSYFMTIGDSKTTHSYWWQGQLRALKEASTNKLWDEGVPIATSGWTTADMAGGIDAGLAAAVTTPTNILINLGANDVTADAVVPSEATWKANTTYIVDACRTKYPIANIYLDHTWKRSNNTASATLKTWRNAVIATYASNVFAGLDETSWLENGDNGVTYTADGIHYNAAGLTQKATLMSAVIS